MFISSWNKKLF